MRLAIDLQGAQSPSSRHRGIGRYTLSLALAMVRQRGPHEIFICLSGLFPDSIAPLSEAFIAAGLPEPYIKVWQAPGPIAGTYRDDDWRRNSAELIREAFLSNLHPDMVLVCSLFEGVDAATSIGRLESLGCKLPTAAILYDLIPLIYSERYLETPLAATWYENKLEHLRRADLLLSISESSRQEGIRHLGLPPDRVVNISTAADAHFEPTPVSAEHSQALADRYGLHRDFVMYTGGIDHRKNVEGLIRAYARLPQALRAQHQLAIVCSIEPEARAALNALAREQGMGGGELVLTGFVPEEHLLSLYNLCKVFVFPSWHEGFGLPALEAMSCGCAVIGADTSSLPEVIGRADALFDPHCDGAIAAKLEQVLTDESFRLELSRHGLAQARNFSWTAGAQRVIAAMEDWLQKHPQPSADGLGQDGSASGTLPPPMAVDRATLAKAIAALAGTPSAAERLMAEQAMTQACPGSGPALEPGYSVDSGGPYHYPDAPTDTGRPATAEPRAVNDERKHTLVNRILARLRNLAAPGLSWRRRLRLVPLLGYFLAWCNALLRLPVARLQAAQEAAELRAGLSELQHSASRHLAGIEKALQAATADIAKRLDRFDEIGNGVAQRIHRLDAMAQGTATQLDTTGRRLNSIEALNVAYRLNRLDALDIANRLNVFDGINIANRLNAFDALDIAGRLSHFDALDIATRLQAIEVKRLADIEALVREQISRDLERDHRIAGLAREVRTAKPKAAAVGKGGQRQDGAFDADSFYFEFESRFRGERSAIKERMRIYLPHFASLAGDRTARVVDIGCGRGEWLELLGESGIAAQGVDLSGAMVETCQELGMQAECGDAIAWLQQQAPASLAAITGFHIIEHLPFETLIALFDAALHALRDDGLILFETPNAENLVVGACNFYTDPTHERPVVPIVAEFIARQRGFAKAEILRVNAYPDDYLLPEKDELARRLNRLIYGPQDYALVAWKTCAA